MKGIIGTARIKTEANPYLLNCQIGDLGRGYHYFYVSVDAPFHASHQDHTVDAHALVRLQNAEKDDLPFIRTVFPNRTEPYNFIFQFSNKHLICNFFMKAG